MREWSLVLLYNRNISGSNPGLSICTLHLTVGVDVSVNGCVVCGPLMDSMAAPVPVLLQEKN